VNIIEQITYEQLVFRYDLVEGLYKIVPSIVEDGEWHPMSVPSGEPSFYRVRSGYFQVIYSKGEHTLLREALKLEPMMTLDNAEWVLERHDEGEYLVRTQFSQTFGPTKETDLLDKVLEPYGLWLENMGTHLSGAATFEALDAEHLLEACNRIKWLEQFCIAANQRVILGLNAFWGAIRNEVEAQIERDGALALSFESGGPKRRVPISWERAEELVSGSTDGITELSDLEA
jgi:hypothetical protein